MPVSENPSIASILNALETIKGFVQAQAQPPQGVVLTDAEPELTMEEVLGSAPANEPYYEDTYEDAPEYAFAPETAEDFAQTIEPDQILNFDETPETSDEFETVKIVDVVEQNLSNGEDFVVLTQVEDTEGQSQVLVNIVDFEKYIDDVRSSYFKKGFAEGGDFAVSTMNLLMQGNVIVPRAELEQVAEKLTALKASLAEKGLTL